MSNMEQSPLVHSSPSVVYSESISARKAQLLAATIAFGSLSLGCFLAPVFMTGLTVAMVQGLLLGGTGTGVLAGLMAGIARLVR